MRADPAIVFLMVALATAPVLAQPSLPGQPGVPAVACGPSNNGPACQSLRQAVPGGAIPGLVAPRLAEPPPLRPVIPRGADVSPQRIMPPRVAMLLRDRRIDPLTRAYLEDLVGKSRASWTVQDLQTASLLLPTLSELGLPPALLGEIYVALGLDPASVFEPQLGMDWQASSTALDPRRRQPPGARCVRLQTRAAADPASVRIQDLLDCNADG
ncbi:hypothetical protein [Teichococcus oryzae]|uniref:Uncharacterized protein n=1 Tax=Teichococcus oryzae TaxID=1608942 RepID=A0A5B2TFJ6_9PROT|nr:hypothetical protein [Pseudoroseomonas oryzae]KAA2212949.1 hypothetical protein F0Q34_12545 [Pseudoroseomonas oryzae]